MSPESARVEIIRRDAPGEAGRVDVFTVPFVPDKTVLQVLLDLFGERDRSLAFRRQRCNRGVCGACLMRVNGQAKRACSTPMMPAMVLEPAQEGDLVKDLVVDQGGRDILGNGIS